MIQVADLFPRIEQVSGLTFIRYVNVGSNRAAVVQDTRKRVWIQKTEAIATATELLAESVGWLLGKAIKAPLPAAAVCLDEGHRAWLSREIEDFGEWSPDHADLLVNHDDVGAMVTLDLLILNWDRKPDNLLVTPDTDELHLRAWAIDAGCAAAGHPSGFAEDNKTTLIPDMSCYARGLPLNKIKNGAEAAAITAASLTEAQLRGIAVTSCGIARDSNHEVLFETLRDRCGRASELLPIMWKALEARS